MSKRDCETEGPKPDSLYADTIILPRDLEANKRKHLEMLKDNCAKPLPPDEFPKNARGSWLSIQRNMVAPSIFSPDAPLVRSNIDKQLQKRDFVIYVDPTNENPTRIGIFPGITNREVKQVYLDAGYPHVGESERPEDIDVDNVSVLTETAKMGCYSFNLPAGPTKLGGTCPASNLGFMYLSEEDMQRTQKSMRDPNQEIKPSAFICNGCYAIKGSYGNPSMFYFMAMRLMMTKALLKIEAGGSEPRFHYLDADGWTKLQQQFPKPKKGGRVPVSVMLEAAHERGMLKPVDFGFSELMTGCIQQARASLRVRRAKLNHFGYTREEYARTERALNLKKHRDTAHKLMDAVQNESIKPAARQKAQESLDKLINATGLSVEDFLAPLPAKTKRRKGEQDDEASSSWDWQLPDPEYFRMHDAGDFFSNTYFDAWMKVCRDIPDVWFWAPTRVWAYRGSLSDDRLRKIPANLALRPSTLHFRQLPPSAAYLDSLGLPKYRDGGGLSAASGAAPEVLKAGEWKCPAYDHWTKGGGAIRLDPKEGKGVGGTCVTARGPNGENGCRACWRYNDTVVVYEEH